MSPRARFWWASPLTAQGSRAAPVQLVTHHHHQRPFPSRPSGWRLGRRQPSLLRSLDLTRFLVVFLSLQSHFQPRCSGWWSLRSCTALLKTPQKLHFSSCFLVYSLKYWFLFFPLNLILSQSFTWASFIFDRKKNKQFPWPSSLWQYVASLCSLTDTTAYSQLRFICSTPFGEAELSYALFLFWFVLFFPLIKF